MHGFSYDEPNLTRSCIVLQCTGDETFDIAQQLHLHQCGCWRTLLQGRAFKPCLQLQLVSGSGRICSQGAAGESYGIKKMPQKTTTPVLLYVCVAALAVAVASLLNAGPPRARRPLLADLQLLDGTAWRLTGRLQVSRGDRLTTAKYNAAEGTVERLGNVPRRVAARCSK